MGTADGVVAVLTSWPAPTVAGVVILTLIFRSQVAEFLGRLTGVGKKGLTATPPPQESVTEDAAEAGGVDNAELPNLTLEQRAQIVTLFAQKNLELSFERFYRVIYGSQLAALEFINSRGGSGAEIAVLEVIHFAKANLGAEVTFEKWFGFLEDAQLVSRSQRTALITENGRSFLIYILRQGYVFNKPW